MKTLLSVLLVLIAASASAQVQDVSLVVVAITPTGATLQAEARHYIARGDYLGGVDCSDFTSSNWMLTRIDTDGYHSFPFHLSTDHCRAIFTPDLPGIYRLQVNDSLGLTASADFRKGSVGLMKPKPGMASQR